MKVKILQLLDSGIQRSILELGLKNGKVIITKSLDKKFEERIKRQSIPDVNGKRYKITDGLSFLKALLFHYRSAYFMAVKER